MGLVRTTRFHRGKLPHWEVAAGRYFITVRLADSLPRNIVLQLQEIHGALADIASRSSQFSALQRRYFHTMEKYLDAGTGKCLLKESSAAEIVLRELTGLREWNVDVPHYAIMPNHWHAIIVPGTDCQHSLGEIMKRVKGRSGKYIREVTGDSGAVWQREWFDRWMGDDTEYEKTVCYIRVNPVKAGLVARWEEHRWTR